MTDPCFGPEQWDEILRLDPSDPRRSHLDTCPRCQARLLVYQEFLEDVSSPPGADPGDAAANLRTAFEQELRSAALYRVSPGRERRDRTVPPERAARFRWPRLRLPWTLAAGVLVIGVLIAGLEIRSGRERIDVLRDLPERPSSVPSGGPDPISTREREGGAIELHWRRAPGADGYRVRLFGSDLADLVQLGPVVDTLYVLHRDEIPGQAGRTIGWQVAALAGGRPFATSRPGTVHIP
jgi:hypothetical protein